MSSRIYYNREAAQRARRGRVVLAAVALGLGIGISAALALLFAPQAGKKTRRAITKQVDEITSQGREAVKRAAEDLQTGASRVRAVG